MHKGFGWEAFKHLAALKYLAYPLLGTHISINTIWDGHISVNERENMKLICHVLLF